MPQGDLQFRPISRIKNFKLIDVQLDKKQVNNQDRSKVVLVGLCASANTQNYQPWDSSRMETFLQGLLDNVDWESEEAQLTIEKFCTKLKVSPKNWQFIESLGLRSGSTLTVDIMTDFYSIPNNNGGRNEGVYHKLITLISIDGREINYQVAKEAQMEMRKRSNRRLPSLLGKSGNFDALDGLESEINQELNGIEVQEYV